MGTGINTAIMLTRKTRNGVISDSYVRHGTSVSRSMIVGLANIHTFFR